MSLSNFCSNCGEFAVFGLDRHRCPPAWECCDPEMDPDYWRIVRAEDEEGAAAKFCENQDRDSADYTYARAGEAEILVRADEDAKPVRIFVRIETVAEYTGRLRVDNNGSL